MQASASRLQTVIKVRTFQVKTAQRELAAIKINRENEEGALTRLEETQISAKSDAVKEVKTRAGDLQTSQAFIDSLSRKIKSQEEKVGQIEERENTKREELVERSQSEQMLEKLDQKRKGEAAKDVEKKAQRIIDVLAQRRRMRL